MKQLLFPIVLLLTLSLTAQPEIQTRYIEVNGSAELEVQPDEFVLFIGIEEYWKEEFEKRKDPEDYRTKVPLAEIEDALIKDLRKAGIDKEDRKSVV